MSRIARLLNSSAEVWRETRTADDMGGWVSGWSLAGVVRARFSQPSAVERNKVIADQAGADLSHVAYLLPTADVRRGDELRRGAQVFEVLATYEPSEPGTYLRADCRRRQEGV